MCQRAAKVICAVGAQKKCVVIEAEEIIQEKKF